MREETKVKGETNFGEMKETLTQLKFSPPKQSGSLSFPWDAIVSCSTPWPLFGGFLRKEKRKWREKCCELSAPPPSLPPTSSSPNHQNLLLWALLDSCPSIPQLGQTHLSNYHTVIQETWTLTRGKSPEIGREREGYRGSGWQQNRSVHASGKEKKQDKGKQLENRIKSKVINPEAEGGRRRLWQVSNVRE